MLKPHRNKRKLNSTILAHWLFGRIVGGEDGGNVEASFGEVGPVAAKLHPDDGLGIEEACEGEPRAKSCCSTSTWCRGEDTRVLGELPHEDGRGVPALVFGVLAVGLVNRILDTLEHDRGLGETTGS